MSSHVPSSRPKNRIGEVVSGRYRLDSTIGAGGQGAVYRATDLRDGDTVAVKVLHTNTAQDPIARERMVREIHALVVLWGTSAVRVLDQGFSNDGSLCLIMEYLRGMDLEAYCDHYQSKGHPLGIDHVFTIFEPVVGALEKAHSNGIIHRDLKPANIFLVYPSHGGGVRVLDFGFAKFTRMSALTAAGIIAGSPNYIAPESWNGSAADPRVDVYSLGAMVYRVFVGEPPFVAEDLVALMTMVRSGPRPSLYQRRTDLPPMIDDWLDQALAIDPNARFQSVRALWNALRAVLG